MSEYDKIYSYLQKLESKQNFISKGLSASKCANKFDLNGFLELLSTTNGVNLQLKLFSALSAYLMYNKGANIDVIIKCDKVYDKIQNVLSRSPPRKSTEALNFLSALLYIDIEEDNTTRKSTLGIYARNMTRISGCLSTMCEMFCSCIMYDDTWKALCQCVAVTCGKCEMNQSYCSHLIPVCIQKCSQMNIDVLLVLQCLLQNHSRNVQLFLDCNGTSIFTRELLHYDKCLQLLTTIVQSSKIICLLQRTNVLSDLRDFLRMYGPKSQLGQKAIIILNHVSSSAKEIEIQQKAVSSETIMHANKSPINEIDATTQNYLENDVNENTENDLEETKLLFQNVMKEVCKWKQNGLQNFKKAEPVLNAANLFKRPMVASKQVLACKRKPVNGNTKNTLPAKKPNKLTNKITRNRYHCNTTDELSFSFLNDDFKISNNNSSKVNLYKDKNDIQLQDSINIEDTQSSVTNFYDTMLDATDVKPYITLKHFEPMFASTPKRTPAKVNYTGATSKNARDYKLKQLKLKRQQAKKERQNKKEIKNCSLSARLFGAINDSCTTFVKTVTNIFNMKKCFNASRNSTSNTESLPVSHKRPSKYSFIEYMRKRDAALSNRWIEHDRREFSEANSCKTCNDTRILKQKLTKDEFLKQTVKKLKFGINLYGCDFRKISKTIWPRDTYMTPQVLYNLYRKLLLK